MGNKVSRKFKPLTKVLDKMYKDRMSMAEEMYFLCHLTLLDDKANLVDDVIRAWGTKVTTEIMLTGLKREINNPENFVDKNDTIPFVRVYDNREMYSEIGNVLAKLRKKYSGIRGYCIFIIGDKKGSSKMENSLFIIGEKNILDGNAPFYRAIIGNARMHSRWPYCAMANDIVQLIFLAGVAWIGVGRVIPSVSSVFGKSCRGVVSPL